MPDSKGFCPPDALILLISNSFANPGPIYSDARHRVICPARYDMPYLMSGNGSILAVWAFRQCCTRLAFGFKLNRVSNFHRLGDHLQSRLTIFRAGIRISAISLVLVLGACASGVSSTSANAPTEPDKAGLVSTLVRTGAEAERTHNFEAAVGYYARLLQLQPDNPEVVEKLARNLRYLGRADKAADLLVDQLKKYPDHAHLTLELGKAYLAAGRTSEAQATLHEAGRIAPGNWQVHSALGIAYDSEGDFVNAQIEFQKGLVLSPGNSSILNNLAMSQAQAGHMDKAVKTLEQAANIDRDNMQIRQNLALLYGIQGKSDKARALAAMDLEPKDVETNLSFYRRFGESAQ